MNGTLEAVPATTGRTIKISITGRMLSELMMSEVETFDGSPDFTEDAPRMAMIDAITKASETWWAKAKGVPHAQQTKRAAVLEINETAAQGLAWALDTDIDKWGDWGVEGVGFIRAARRILVVLGKEFPEAYKEGVSPKWLEASNAEMRARGLIQ